MGSIRQTLVLALLVMSSPLIFSEDRSASKRLSVYPDCKRFECPWDYLRNNLNLVDIVRDPEDADIHLLVILEEASNGEMYGLQFIGQTIFEDLSFKTSYFSPEDNTGDMTRKEILRKVRLGLVPFLLDRPESDYLSINIDTENQEQLDHIARGPEKTDPWNCWVFKTEVGMSVEDEDRRDKNEHWGSLNANRTTESYRLGMGYWREKKSQSFILEDGSTLKDDRIRQSITGYAIKSLGDHWGVGLGASQRKSTYRNLDNSFRIASAIEYNVYPYQLTAEKALTFGYFLGHTSFDYELTTILGLDKEKRPDHGLFAEYDVQQPWGFISVRLRTSQFLNDTEYYSLSLGGDLDYRITKGLSINLWGNYSLTKNQIYLAATEASNEDLLLKTKALDTNTRSNFGLSLKYSFGSIYNNVVNNRLRGSGFTRVYD